MSLDMVTAALEERFARLGLTAEPLLLRGPVPTGQLYVRVAPEHLVEVMTFLRDDPRTRFEQLVDVTGVDYLEFPDARDRYGVIYGLLSLTHGHRLWVKCFVNDPDPAVPTLTGVWAGANWPEREVFDMFGVRFEGHPDLRRLLTWDGFVAHPLRKDYPLTGLGEREDYEVTTRESS